MTPGVSTGFRSSEPADGSDAITAVELTPATAGRQLRDEVAEAVACVGAVVALRERESVLNSAMRLAGIGSWVMDLERRQVQWSPHGLRLFGMTPEEGEGGFEAFRARILEEDRPLLDAAFARSFQSTAETAGVEYRIRQPDGMIRWIFGRASVERDEAGTPRRLHGVVMDITERKLAEEERSRLLASEQAARRQADDASRYYRTLFEGAPGSYAVLRAEDLVVVTVSEAFIATAMLPREAIVGRRLLEAFPAQPGEALSDQVEVLRSSFERVRATRQTDVMGVVRYPLRRPAAAGGGFEERFWSIVNCPVPGPDGELAYIICRVEDVTEYVRLKQQAGNGAKADITLQSRAELLEADVVLRALEVRRANEERAQSQAILRIASGIARLGGWVVSLPDRTVTWSDETAALLGEVPGTRPSIEAAMNHYLPDQRPRIAQALEACIRDGAPFDLESQIVTRQGQPVGVRLIGEARRDEAGVITSVHGAIQDISAQIAAAEQIRSLSVRLRETLETITDGFFTLDRDWRVTFLNPAAERLLGRHGADLKGRVLFDAVKGETVSKFNSEYHRALLEGVPVSFEAFYPPLNRWLETEAYPSREGLAVYVRDVTERRKSREALRESEERFRLVVTAAKDVIWDWNPITDVLWWSDGFTELFGYPLDETEHTLVSRTTRLHPDDAPGIMASVHAVMAGTALSWSGEYRFRRRDGTYAHVVDRAHIVRDSAGTVVRMVGAMTDFSERKRDEERLREQATLLDQANDAIMVRDLYQQILYWNRSAERMYGWSAAEATGQSVKGLLKADPEAAAAATETTITRGEWTGELRKMTKSGQVLVVQGRWTLVRDEYGRPRSILAIDTDITERKKLEAQFLRAQRMESIGALAGGIAHDLNNTLAPILLTVSVLKSEAQDPSLIEDLSTIDSCAHRAADMVRQLLTFARGTEGVRKQNDLGIVAIEIQNIVRDTFPKDITFSLQVASDAWKVTSDATQMHQLLTNLCVNARDAMPLGGRLTVAIDNVRLDEVEAGMNLGARPGPYVRIQVEDTGTGMSPEVLDRIFEPFFTTKTLGKGTGLGLSTAHAIVRNHGGFIQVHSEPGRGTRFNVYLPADPSAAASAQAADDASLPRGRGEVVLVVDDEEMIRAVTRRTLERFGYEVLLADNGAEAVSQYVRHRDRIAVVLTDMAMPIMDGPATIAALRSLDPGVRIIGSSGFDAGGHISKVVGASVNDFVPKPYTAEILLTVLSKVLGEAREAKP